MCECKCCKAAIKYYFCPICFYNFNACESKETEKCFPCPKCLNNKKKANVVCITSRP